MTMTLSCMSCFYKKVGRIQAQLFFKVSLPIAKLGSNTVTLNHHQHLKYHLQSVLFLFCTTASLSWNDVSSCLTTKCLVIKQRPH